MIIIYTKWHIAVMCIRRDMQNVIYIPTYKWRNSNVIITPNVIATLFWGNGGVIVTWCVRRGCYTAPRYHTVNFTWNYSIIIYIYYSHTYIIQISIYVINNISEPDCNLAVDACMGRTQLSHCIISVLGQFVPTGMSCQHDIFSCWATCTQIFFGNKCNIVTTTVLLWNLYPIFILLNQLAVKITRPSLSFGCICISSSTCIIFTYYTHDNQQECSRLSISFSLWCLGPWKNHLAPVWWSNFRPMFLNDSWCVTLLWWRGIFYWCFAFTIVFIHYPSFTYYLSSQVILLWNSFLYQVLCIVIFQWLSLYSYLT